MGFFDETYQKAMQECVSQVDWSVAEALVAALVRVRTQRGRVFVLGLGGSAGNAGHFVNDLRKLAGIEAYAPTDNVSELTARINDDGWGNAFVGWLKTSAMDADDAVFVLSVGGGDLARGVSLEVVNAVEYARAIGASILGIVGRDGGHAARVGDQVLVVPIVNRSLVTPISEAFQAVIWHGIVSHPDLAVASAHWESLAGP